jgi:hypothetical protein
MINEEIKSRAIAELAKGNELYYWPSEYETEETFAFLVLYKGKNSEGWIVALHDKKVNKSEHPDWGIEIDALRFNSSEKKVKLPTAKEAVNYAISEYSIDAFVDYDSILQRYIKKYIKV